MRRFVADVTPLRASKDYRRLWAGYSIAQVGQQMTAVAVAIQVYDLTRSSFAVGLVGLFALVPLVGFGLYGGAVVDALDRRLIALWTSVGLWLLSLVLLLQAVLDLRQVEVLYAVVAAQSALFAVNNPARAAMVPRLIGLELLPAAQALSSLSFNLGFTLGPLLGATLINLGGYQLAYGVDALLYLAALWAAWRLPPVPPLGAVTRPGLRSMLDGIRFLRTRANVLMTFLVDLAAMVLAQPRALFPEVGQVRYDAGVRAVGLLQAAPAIGSVLAAASSGWIGRVRRQGLAVLVCVMGYGLAVAGFGASPTLWLAVLFLALSGAFDMVSAAYRSTILQAASPDDMRGRLQGVFIVVVAGGPRLGDFVAGSAASLSTPAFAAIAGGCACAGVVAVLAVRFPRFRAYDARHPEP